MVNLHPNLRTVLACGFGPSGKGGKWGIGLKSHATGPRHCTTVDHDITGNDQANTTLRPALV